MNYTLVFIGGGLGSVTRLAFSKWFGTISNSFPLATLFANTVSSFLLGMLVGYFFSKQMSDSQTKFFVFAGTGFCGGFSTFSTFSWETVQLFSSGKISLAVANIFLSVTISLAGVLAGYFVSKNF